MRLEDNSNINNKSELNGYKLRKTMLTFMKIKYFQLLKSYIQLGNKKDFIQLLLENKIGTIELYEEIVYYMAELINNLVGKDYNKYSFLLNVDGVISYKNKLLNLYMQEDDFRTSIELNLIFQIGIIIMIFEDMYDVTMLREYYENEQTDDNSWIMSDKKEDNIEKIKNDDEEKSWIINSEVESDDKEFEKEMESEDKKEDRYNNKENQNEDKINNISFGDEIIYKNNKINQPSRNINNLNYKITENISNTLAPLKNKLTYFSSFNNSKDEENINEENKNNIITLKENPEYKNYIKEEKDIFIYKDVLKNYKKLIKSQKRKEELNNNLNTEKIKLSPKELNLRSKFSIVVYKFLFSLVSKVEIREEDSKDIILLKKTYKNNYISKLSKEISNKIIITKEKDKFLQRQSVQEKIERIEPLSNNNNSKNKQLKFRDEKDKFFFYIKPYVIFHLDEETKENFLLNVDRSSAKMKFRSLVIFSDYAIFEMMYNMKFVNIYSFFTKLSKVKFRYLQIFNYLLILTENILLMIHHYKDYSVEKSEYDVIDKDLFYKRFPDIIVIIVIKTVINIICCILWFYLKFALELEKNLLDSTDKTFIFRQRGEKNQNINNPIMVKYFQKDGGNIFETIDLIIKELDIFTKLKIIIFDTIVFNLDINIFFFSFVLNLLYLIFSHPLFLSFETLFIFGIFPSLINIFKAFETKYSSLIFCLIFTYLLVYIYTWLIIFYMRNTFIFEEVFDYESGQYITEVFCHSFLQCFLILISYGTRSGGGIADNLPTPSFKNSTKMFFGRFVLDMTFYILIIMVMGNITFGLIVDSFGKLRDDTDKFENDKNNICFICQLSRDKCLLKNIDFDSHIKNEHNLWNYVNFLIFLHLNNPNDFSRFEGLVWDKLLERDFGWIPVDPDAGEEDD